MKTIIRAVWNTILFLFTSKGPVGDKAVNDEICDFGGQGRDKYGN